MFASSVMRVVQSTPTRLVIVDPPYYLGGGILMLIGIILGAVLLNLKVQNSTRIAVIVTLPIFIAGLGALTSQTVMTFSRETGTVSIQRRWFGFSRSKIEVPLDSVRYATVQTQRGSRRFAIVLTSGRVLAPGSATTQGGEYDVTNAINDFLKGSGQAAPQQR